MTATEHRVPRIVNPSYGFPTEFAAGQNLAATVPAVVPDGPTRLALFSNSKPNADRLLLRVADELAAAGAISGYDLLAKPQASQPGSEDLLGQICRGYRVALLAIAD